MMIRLTSAQARCFDRLLDGICLKVEQGLSLARIEWHLAQTRGNGITAALGAVKEQEERRALVRQIRQDFEDMLASGETEPTLLNLDRKRGALLARMLEEEAEWHQEQLRLAELEGQAIQPVATGRAQSGHEDPEVTRKVLRFIAAVLELLKEGAA